MPTPAQVPEHLRSGCFPVKPEGQAYIKLAQEEEILRATTLLHREQNKNEPVFK